MADRRSRGGPDRSRSRASRGGPDRSRSRGGPLDRSIEDDRSRAADRHRAADRSGPDHAAGLSVDRPAADRSCVADRHRAAVVADPRIAAAGAPPPGPAGRSRAMAETLAPAAAASPPGWPAVGDRGHGLPAVPGFRVRRAAEAIVRRGGRDRAPRPLAAGPACRPGRAQSRRGPIVTRRLAGVHQKMAGVACLGTAACAKRRLAPTEAAEGLPANGGLPNGGLPNGGLPNGGFLGARGRSPSAGGGAPPSGRGGLGRSPSNCGLSRSRRGIRRSRDGFRLRRLPPSGRPTLRSWRSWRKAAHRAFLASLNFSRGSLCLPPGRQPAVRRVAAAREFGGRFDRRVPHLAALEPLHYRFRVLALQLLQRRHQVGRLLGAERRGFRADQDCPVGKSGHDAAAANSAPTGRMTMTVDGRP